jgi:hypothetical protein
VNGTSSRCTRLLSGTITAPVKGVGIDGTNTV